jgi:anti-anti-sigma regulatory factor
MTWSGLTAIVRIPAQFELAAIESVTADLLAAITCGAELVVVDLSATVVYERAATDTLVGAYWLAVLAGTEMRLVAPGQAARTALTIGGLDDLVRVYPSLGDAIADQSHREFGGLKRSSREWQDQ